MENPWRAPVVAVEDGRLEYWESSLGGCMLYHYGVSGTTYLYIHLNNDLTAHNDNKGGCVKDVAFAVPDGAKVTAGQQIAWVGDSGDASGNPHLHFEVHPNDGPDVDPFKYLKRASKPLFAARKGAVFSLGLRGDARRRRGRHRDGRGRPRAPVSGRPLARHRSPRGGADGSARHRRPPRSRPADGSDLASLSRPRCRSPPTRSRRTRRPRRSWARPASSCSVALRPPRSG